VNWNDYHQVHTTTQCMPVDRFCRTTVTLASVCPVPQLTFADIPGLIRGASKNRGLGHRFLRSAPAAACASATAASGAIVTRAVPLRLACARRLSRRSRSVQHPRSPRPHAHAHVRRHVERTKALVYMVDIAAIDKHEPEDALQVLVNELAMCVSPSVRCALHGLDVCVCRYDPSLPSRAGVHCAALRSLAMPSPYQSPPVTLSACA
jgi:hypothetical protein